ncbi:class I SAM-dependent DNA methyltransferase [Ohtaekwangia koreensis]|uniref:Methyltransferase domain-containing protein n=1 Tax=Ohtaekwangia koreensis TaxID=688867 RepID=A0A1T5LED6_9BACT|nr:methyltransferase domain-containing protein [Ohtaekwangia koreensis]SKC74224.1 Methyltransferase domain-containing protein [Ohtaekwangia koreensis]
MAAPFDHIASAYDSVFTQSAIGQLQRKQVWRYLEEITPQLSGLEILELNCGTGEDAVLFSEKGFNIVATDVSEEMLKVTQQKAHQFSMQSKISSHYLDLDSFDETLFDKKFDLVFSNFGGLNCINPESFKKLLQKLPLILSPKGRFIAVVMPKFCLWESIYFLTRFQFKNIFRRWTSTEVVADLHGTAVKTWYFKPSQIKMWSSENFKVISRKPVGFALPPSYLENFFSSRKRLLFGLNVMEKKVSGFSFLSGMADHFIIDLRLR